MQSAGRADVLKMQSELLCGLLRSNNLTPVILRLSLFSLAHPNSLQHKRLPHVHHRLIFIMSHDRNILTSISISAGKTTGKKTGERKQEPEM